jgi:hypothetical protein
VRVTRIRRFVSRQIRRLWRKVGCPRPAAPPLLGAIGAEFREGLEKLARLKEEFHPAAKAFERAVPAIVERFRSEADDLIDPAIYFDAVAGEIEVIEYLELIGHIPEFQDRPRRMPGERATIALAIAGESLTRLDRVPDPRWHSDESPWVAARHPV